MFPALLAAIESVHHSRSTFYNDIVLAGLPAAVRARWEEFVTATLGNPYISDVMCEAWAEGEAKGEASGVLTVLEARGVAVPDVIREQILARTDLARLDTWLRRAVTAATVIDVIDD
jgi:hypothetical protein